MYSKQKEKNPQLAIVYIMPLVDFGFIQERKVDTCNKMTSLIIKYYVSGPLFAGVD